MNAARENLCQRSVAGCDTAPEKWLRALLGLALAAAFALPGAGALAQSPHHAEDFNRGRAEEGAHP